MTKILTYGDVHLGQGAHYPRRLDDQADVLNKIADLAIERQVDGVLNAGDTFEGPSIPPEQLQVFARFVARLREAEIPHLAITGNSRHDAAVRDTNGMAIFNHIEGIEVCSQPGVHLFAGCGVAVLPWVHPGRLIARAGRDVPRDEVNAIAADLLVDVARELRGQSNIYVDGNPTILLGHWSVSGSALPAGLPVDELREPVLPIDELEALGFDHIVMGHIHAPQGLGGSHERHLLFDSDRDVTYGSATAFYTGSPMPLNHGEANVPHGVWILDADTTTGGAASTFIPIDSPRFVTLDLGSDADEEWGLGNAIADALGGDTDALDDAIVRVRFTATSEQMSRIDVPALRAALDIARVVTVEPQIIREQRARLAGVDEHLDELAALELWINANAIDGDAASAMRAKTRSYLQVVA